MDKHFWGPEKKKTRQNNGNNNKGGDDDNNNNINNNNKINFLYVLVFICLLQSETHGIDFQNIFFPNIYLESCFVLV